MSKKGIESSPIVISIKTRIEIQLFIDQNCIVQAANWLKSNDRFRAIQNKQKLCHFFWSLAIIIMFTAKLQCYLLLVQLNATVHKNVYTSDGISSKVHLFS